MPVESIDDSSETNGNVSSKVFSFLGTAINVTKNVASTVKNKVSDLELGDKLYYVGGKTADILYNASHTIYEKGTEIAVLLIIFYPLKI